jgi:hypothetical protein
LNETNQLNQINQINKTNQMNQTEWISSIYLWAELPRLGQELVRYRQEQLERLRARLAGPLVLMQQQIPLAWEQRAALEEQVSPA